MLEGINDPSEQSTDTPRTVMRVVCGKLVECTYTEVPSVDPAQVRETDGVSDPYAAQTQGWGRKVNETGRKSGNAKPEW